MKLYTTTQIKQLEELALTKDTVADISLMQRAGIAAFNLFQAKYPNASNIAIFCGGGNNAGDGYALAALIKEINKNVTCIYLKNPTTLKNPALTAYQIAKNIHVCCIEWCEQLQLNDYDVFIDALLGTGFKDKLADDYYRAIQKINDLHKPIIALDVPSGLNADTGCVPEIAIKAQQTVTFIAAKQGLYTADAKEYCGDIFVDDLTLSAKLFNKVSPMAELIALPKLKQNYLSPRKHNSNKSDFGHVVIIGGDQGMAGAVRVTSEVCARVGTGLTTVITHLEHLAVIVTARPEIMAHPFTDLRSLDQLVTRATIIAVGPGLGRQDWGKQLFNAVLTHTQPKILDADALWWLAKTNHYSDNWVLTPHPKEAARLLGTTVKEIQTNRFKAIEMIQRKYGGVIVLKGSGSLVYDGKHPIQICSSGNPGMSSGGMGDALTGIIAGLAAQTIPLFEATCLGVDLHAKAADLCAQKEGERGMLALDLIPYIRHLINRT